MTEKHVVTMTGKKINMRCGQCQSNDIVVDAWAQWSVEKQDFELHTTFDAAFCLACEEACDVDEYYIEQKDEGLPLPDVIEGYLTPEPPEADTTIINWDGTPASVGEFSEGCAGYPASTPMPLHHALHPGWKGLGDGAKK